MTNQTESALALLRSVQAALNYPLLSATMRRDLRADLARAINLLTSQNDEG